jgi:hypothetical protein
MVGNGPALTGSGRRSDVGRAVFGCVANIFQAVNWLCAAEHAANRSSRLLKSALESSE